jgi:hypothetical protein
LSSDVPALMGGVPALARAARYGSVRRTDADEVLAIVRELVTRIAVGLPGAATALDDDAAATLHGRIDAVDGALGTLADAELLAQWRGALARAMDRADAHPLIAGRACRILRDGGALAPEQVARRMDRALSRANPPLAAGAWLEGFLTGSGLALIHDPALVGLVDAWLGAAPEEGFTTVLPVLRRTFATFPSGERRQIGEQVRRGTRAAAPAADVDLDEDRAALVLPVLERLLELGG